MNNNKFDYTYNQILKAISKCNIKSGDTVYVTGNLTKFGRCDLKNYNDLPKIFHKALIHILKEWLIVLVPIQNNIKLLPISRGMS